jgi:hypothetical protein
MQAVEAAVVVVAVAVDRLSRLRKLRITPPARPGGVARFDTAARRSPGSAIYIPADVAM